MRRLLALLLLILLIATPAFAGEKGGADYGDIAGVVLDVNGEPAPKASVRWEYGPFMQEVQADKAGRFRLESVPYADVDVSATLGKSLQPRLRVELAGRGATREVTLRLVSWNLTIRCEKAKAVEGVLVTTKPDAAVAPQPVRGRRMKDGRLVFLASPGPCELWLRDEAGERWLVERREIGVKHAGAQRRLETGRVIKGRVLDADGEGVAAELVFRRAGGVPVALDSPELRTAMSKASGRFRSRPLPPGEWRVTVRARDPKLAVSTVAVPAKGPLELRLAPARTIRLRRDEGWPEGLSVAAEGPLGISLAKTDDARVLELRGMPADGAAVLRVSAREPTPRCAVVPISAKDGVKEVKVKLAGAPVVSGIMTLAGKPLPEHSELYFWREHGGEATARLSRGAPRETPSLYDLIQDQARRGTTSQSIGRAGKDGRYRLTLAPGAWRVGFSLDRARTIRLEPGETLTVDSER